MMKSTTRSVVMNAAIAVLPGLGIMDFVAAEEIYKSIDKKGAVSYSNLPSFSEENTKTIEVFPAPTDETILATQQELLRSREKSAERQKRTLERVQAAAQKEQRKNPVPPARPYNPFIAVAPYL